MNIFNSVLMFIGIYLLCGLIFALPFVIKGVGVIDPVAKEGSKGFRLLIIPGVMVFWPLLAKRWASGSHPPEQCDAHRRSAVNKAEE